jgi:NAD(P)-dependent dehydrogenase (short-subunit alcohol dehydrogenase family)
MKRTILVTGTSSGFGRATARLFAERGWNVVATIRRPEDERDLPRLPGVLVTRLDVQDRETIAAAISAGIARFGRIDAVVNNAGFGPFEATPSEKIAE